MEQRKETFLKKSISVGEVLSLAIALLASGIIFYTTVQVRLSALELRMLRSEQTASEYQKRQEQFQERIENKIDVIKDKINQVELKSSR
jgi:hypothetical protein